MNAHQDLRLHEWIRIGKQSGAIREARTVVLAYCMDESTMLPWIIEVVEGRMTEEAALVFIERVIDSGTQGTGEAQAGQ